MLHKDVIHHNRSIYNSLDLLGDVGGLFDGLRGIGSFLITIYFRVFGNPIHPYLLKSLFLQNPKIDNNDETRKEVSGETGDEVKPKKNQTREKVKCSEYSSFV